MVDSDARCDTSKLLSVQQYQRSMKKIPGRNNTGIPGCVEGGGHQTRSICMIPQTDVLSVKNIFELMYRSVSETMYVPESSILRKYQVAGYTDINIYIGRIYLALALSVIYDDRIILSPCP